MASPTPLPLDADTLDAMLLADRGALGQMRDRPDTAWLTDMQARVPEPSWWSFVERRRWREAFAAVRATPTVITLAEAVLVPLWICSNEDEAADGDWQRIVLLMGRDGRPDEIADPEAIVGDRLVLVRAERAKRTRLVRSRGYSPEIPMVVRNAQFGACLSEGFERIVEVLAVAASEPVPRPTREVPAFSCDVVPAVSLDALSSLEQTARGDYRSGPDTSSFWRDAVERAIGQLRFITEDEDEAAPLP
jgi:hypothetical protein